MSGVDKKENISIIGAKTNNLKDITLQIPLNAFTCVTGPSGCGKSSLVFDTIFAESQRSFFEGLTGNLNGQKIMEKPDVERIENLRPAVNLAQNYYNVNPRSTVGTVSEISYYLRTIFVLVAEENYNLTMTSGDFSCNTVEGCCPKCNGIGKEFFVDYNKVIGDEDKTLRNGAIPFFKGTPFSFEYKLLEAICGENNINIDIPLREVSSEQLNFLLFGTGSKEYTIRYKNYKGKYKSSITSFKGVVNEINEKMRDIDKPSVYAEISQFLSEMSCSACLGKRYSEKARTIHFFGFDIADIERMSVDTFLKCLIRWKLNIKKSKYSNQFDQLFLTIEKRLLAMQELGLGYLSLDRIIPSLSGGEIQRLRISQQMNCSLTGLLYILDEPCGGLHYRNIEQIILSSKNLVKKGNTVIAIEHNPQYISKADCVIEMGPEGGKGGGFITGIRKQSPQYLFVPNFHKSRGTANFIEIIDASFHNIIHQDFRIPENCITCFTGVSGSGKSSLAQVIIDSIQRKRPTFCLKFVTKCKSIVHVNQQPIGKNGRSTIISYLGVFDDIRNLFSETEEAKKLGLNSSSFSFNVGGERCECCQGTGFQKIEMDYLPESFIVCPKCGGKRYSAKVLTVTYKGLNIIDVLNNPIEDISALFDSDVVVKQKLDCLIEMGLGYLSLGQLTAKLSGGESQRIKLAKALGLPDSSTRLYLLDEPTTGLNQSDIERIKKIINILANRGNTVIIIEHNLDFIATMADFVLDFGLFPGEKGGRAVLYNEVQEAFHDSRSSLYGILNK